MQNDLQLYEILETESVWEAFSRTDLPILLYGTGNGADKILDDFQKYALPLGGVFASDDFARTRTFRGFPVLRYSEAKNTFGDFAVALGFGSSRTEVLARFHALEQAHFVRVPCVPVYGEERFDRAFLSAHRDEIAESFDLLADAQSKIVYRNFLLFQITGKLPYLWASDTEKNEAFHKILRLGQDEQYLDLGAYRGDTVAEFLHYTNGQYASVTAVEPNRKSFEKLTAYCENMQNAKLIEACVADTCGSRTFSGDGRHNAATKLGKTVPCFTVDALKAKQKCTYLKADIEGLECEMLLGAKETLQTQKPKLNIAAYHKSRDIFAIPRLINRINPTYKIYLRKHPYVPFWDLNYYCV